MRRLPSFFALRALEAAARLESFALAGEELHLSASAISHQIRALESYFGRRLFLRRSGQGVEPTADGRLLLARLSPAFDALEAACAAFAPPPRVAAQALALRCAPSFAAKWLGPRLPSFMAQHPEIPLRMTASADPVDFARDASVDVAIVYGARLAQPGVSAEALGSERVMALIAPDLEAALDLTGPALPPELSLIDSAISPIGWETWLATNGLAPLPPGVARPSFDRAAMAIAAAVQGIGAALESTRLASEELARGELVELGGGRFQGVELELHFLHYRAVQRAAPKVAAFRSWLLDRTAAL